jgi:hypothetical protein
MREMSGDCDARSCASRRNRAGIGIAGNLRAHLERDVVVQLGVARTQNPPMPPAPSAPVILRADTSAGRELHGGAVSELVNS